MALAADLALAVAAANEAGAMAMRFYGQELDVSNKSPNDPVSNVDIAIDAFLKAQLREARPNYGWLSEESVDDHSRHSARFCWVVDPIDGTRAFIKAKPHFTICIGLLDHNVPVLGVVFNPATGEMFEAIQGGGARLNGVEIAPSTCDAIEGCAMLGDPAMFRHPAWQPPWPQMDVVSRNSIAYRMCLVACGQYDAAIALSAKQDWDLVAASVIVDEAGAIATTHEGAALMYNQPNPRQISLVVAGRGLHSLLIGRVHHVKLA
ncbi:inositol monophosphatase family protein [Candidatus Phycosocius spiralis]|uniref:3'(2'),5'-bisphosphate nucleotidase CysQ n=1 Tax=Candidatus Phycosocius spiralis TaxID=2815099 RepID=A0ABQ4PWX7_9PROT|nr:3'(2'),5'-bisphosphate nucleotidase CysQ [Candidatus Phycosocius spiralis]GIU67590.1 3'(2'),5'-bisphosphate nucleotidase CysQ [Candidatus Phycosocius spiralis]